jgi:hypothetical protein
MLQFTPRSLGFAPSCFGELTDFATRSASRLRSEQKRYPCSQQGACYQCGSGALICDSISHRIIPFLKNNGRCRLQHADHASEYIVAGAICFFEP